MLSVPTNIYRHGAVWLVLLSSARAAAQQPPAPAPQQAPAAERLSDEAELQRVIGLYDAGKYEECARDLDKLLDGPRRIERRQVRETARVYHAACLIGIGEFEKADKPLTDALRENKQMEQPDALVFPRPVVERFLRVRQSMLEEIKRAEQQQLAEAKKRAEEERLRQQALVQRTRVLEELASREVVVTQNRRWLAVVPFGVGQFQNGDHGLGYFLLGSEVLTLGGALTSLAIATQIDRNSAEIENQGKESDADTRAQDWHLAGRISAWAFISLAAIGIAEAQLSFVPETRTVRRRSLPPPVAKTSAAPTVAFTGEGVSLGIAGKF